MNDDFYIGWEPNAPPRVAKTVRMTVVALLVLAGLIAAGLAASQRLIGSSVFEWGTVRTFSGILQTQPVPHLLVPRPGKTDGLPQFSTYYLVAPWKFGLDTGSIAALNGRAVTLRGTLIHRDNQAMVETQPEWIQADTKDATNSIPRAVPLGRQTFTGEIVDSKCYLGVMNPGRLIPHRACAIRCISGGVPPVLLVRRRDGTTLCLLLVSHEGKPVNRQVLDMVAEPVEITGNLERQGELLVLYADPATYRRLH